MGVRVGAAGCALAHMRVRACMRAWINRVPVRSLSCKHLLPSLLINQYWHCRDVIILHILTEHRPQWQRTAWLAGVTGPCIFAWAWHCGTARNGRLLRMH